MIKERYVSPEIAKLLRNKGFDEPCMSYFWSEENGADIDYSEYPFTNKQLYSGQVLRPTQAMACDWVEEKHNYIIDVHLDVESEEASSWVWSVYERINVEGGEPYARLYFEDDEPYEFDNQEFAYNDALKYVLTNLV